VSIVASLVSPGGTGVRTGIGVRRGVRSLDFRTVVAVCSRVDETEEGDHDAVGPEIAACGPVGANVATCSARSRHDEGRSFGSFARARAKTGSRPAGSPITRDDSAGAGIVTCWFMSESALSPSNGGFPARISYA